MPLTCIGNLMHNVKNNYKKIVLNFIISLVFFGNYSLVFARRIEILAAIPIDNNVKKIITQIQNTIKKSAEENGYIFNTDIVTPDNMHITLEHVADIIEEKDTVSQYEECIQSIARTIQSFDLTESLNKAHFEVMGWKKNWGVLRLVVPKNHPLRALAQKIRKCFENKGLKLGNFPDYKAHLSVGKFEKNEKIKLPKPDKLNWIPKLTINLPAQSFVASNVLLEVREKIENKKTKEVTYINEPVRSFPLGVKRATPTVVSHPQELVHIKKAIEPKPAKQAKKPSIAKKFKIVPAVIVSQNKDAKELRLIKSDMKKRFATAIRNKSVDHAKEAVANLLAHIVAKKLNISVKDSSKHVYELESVKDVFNPTLLNQKATDPSYKLSSHDTRIFNALPEPLQKELLQGRRIVLTSPQMTILAAKTEDKAILEPQPAQISKSIKVVHSAINTSKPAVDQPLIASGFRDNFAAALKINEKRVVNGVKRAVAYILAEVAAENLNTSVGFAYMKIHILANVKEVFNPIILNQKPNDPPYKLSEHDTRIFMALPESLQKELLQGRRIEFAPLSSITIPPRKEDISPHSQDITVNPYPKEDVRYTLPG